MLAFPQWDTDLFVRLNSLHYDWLDPVMQAFSSITLWIPMYFVVLGFIVYKQRLWSIALIAALGVAFALSDYLSVHLFKNMFERLRPCHVESLRQTLHSLEGCGGKYGFISNHAANAFCFALFTALIFRNKYYTTLIFCWAVCVAYSRIYVGKHFPLDVICGAAFGILCQQVATLLYKFIQYAIFHRTIKKLNGEKYKFCRSVKKKLRFINS